MEQESETSEESMIKHPDKAIEHAFTRLSDLICEWERNTGRRSVLIYTEQGLPPIRIVDGKPGVPDTVGNHTLLEMFEQEQARR